jgi:hypothetical protein
MPERTEKNLAYAFAAEAIKGGEIKYLKTHKLLDFFDLLIDTIERK